MAITPLPGDLGDMPWWLQGQGQPLGLGGGAPSTPVGTMVPPSDGQGFSPDDWLRRILGVGSAQAATLDPRAAALAQLRGGGSPVPPGLGGGPTMPPVAPIGGAIPTPPPNPFRGAVNPAMAGVDTPMPPPNPFRGPLAAGPSANANVPAAQAAPISASQPAAAPGPANADPNANPRFTTIAQPNMPTRSAGRVMGGAPMMGALNLAGLFGRGPLAQPNPANQPAPAATPISGQSQPTPTTAPWWMGPYQQKILGTGQPYGPPWPDYVKAHSGFQ